MSIIMKEHGNIGAEVRPESFWFFLMDDGEDSSVEFDFKDYPDLVKMIEDIKPYYEKAMEK